MYTAYFYTVLQKKWETTKQAAVYAMTNGMQVGLEVGNQGAQSSFSSDKDLVAAGVVAHFVGDWMHTKLIGDVLLKYAWILVVAGFVFYCEVDAIG